MTQLGQGFCVLCILALLSVDLYGSLLVYLNIIISFGLKRKSFSSLKMQPKHQIKVPNLCSQDFISVGVYFNSSSMFLSSL